MGRVVRMKRRIGETENRRPPEVVAGRDYCAIALKYARDVVKGRVPACRWVKLACQRQLNDLARQKDKAWPYRFDKEKAAKICKFIELLPHVKGKWDSKTIVLPPWWISILTTVFGWVSKETGLRRYRTVYVEVPRKNSKSTISSGVALYMLAVDGEPGAEVYSSAVTRDQAKIVFDIGRQQALASPKFCARFGVEVMSHNLNVIKSASKFEALSSDDKALDGLNVHCSVIDELHAHRTRRVYDVIETAVGARQQPLIWSITTAGSNLAGICYEQHSYVEKILDGVFEDDSYFGIIYTIDRETEGGQVLREDDWRKPATWAKANPNLGVSVFQDNLADLARKAEKVTSAQNNFLTKRLNVWVNASTGWMNMVYWNACADPALSLENFEGEPCWIGLDLASKVNFAALALVFKRFDDVLGQWRYSGFWRLYLPQTTVETSTLDQLKGWVKMGLVTVTAGNIIDYQAIKDDLLDFKSRFQIESVPYDPFQATQFATEMLAEGFPMIEIGATVKNFSEPMKEWEALVLDRRFTHDGNPAIKWMVSNVKARVDKKDNVFPTKENEQQAIDGPVATIMALNRALGGESSRSVYEDGGLKSV